jgi:hypothetical protein
VAQVIAYVYSLNSVAPGGQKMTKPKPQVPQELIFDESGRRSEPQVSAH